MRLWSLAPSILDRAALVAGWREALLAQKVLAGGTRGYTRHPQLRRFQEHPAPLDAIGAFLFGLHAEATARGYRFDASRIQRVAQDVDPLTVSEGQLNYELAHLRAKVLTRSPEWLPRLPDGASPPPPHPLFRTVSGRVADWEIR